MHPFVILQYLLPHHLISRTVAILAKSRIRWMKNLIIRQFIRIYKVDLSEARSGEVNAYESFNDFFTRRLQPGCRAVSGTICSPADGEISTLGHLSEDRLIQVKGITYSLQQLLATDTVDDYIDGSFITIYLAPKDYHRVHFPLTAGISASRYIPGRLFSVNAATTHSVNGLFTRNERLVCNFNNMIQPMVLVMVGAMIVAGIKPVWRASAYPPGHLTEDQWDQMTTYQQGSELGHFELGSTVILVLKNRVSWTVTTGDTVRMGQPLC